MGDIKEKYKLLEITILNPGTEKESKCFKSRFAQASGTQIEIYFGDSGIIDNIANLRQPIPEDLYDLAEAVEHIITLYKEPMKGG